jgi:S1/P1 Nuclease
MGYYAFPSLIRELLGFRVGSGWTFDCCGDRRIQLVLDVLNGSSMASVANWADDIRHTPNGAWSGPLHFADLPDRDCHFDRNRDCKLNNCVAGAISNYTHRLLTIPRGQQYVESLKFLIHFIGDAHQPLHASGNCRKDNLHAVWDTVMIDEDESEEVNTSPSRWKALAKQLINTVSSEDVSKWSHTCRYDFDYCADVIVSESAKYACDSAYIVTNGTWIHSGDNLGRDYYEHSLAIIESRLLAAGVRLAAILNIIAESTIADIQIA